LKKTFFIFLILFLASCAQEYGNRVVGGNLSVYYIDSKDGALASKLAVFWKKHDLIAEAPQDIKLSRTEEGYRISLIIHDNFEAEMIRFNERKALLELRAMLKDEIFQDQGIELVLSDDQFKPLLQIK
jgi:hypothetical protein